jgi:hypothetical protein
LVLAAFAVVAHGTTLKPFTVAEEIGLATFLPYHAEPPIIASPDGRFVAIRAERGLLDKDRVEDELRVYDRVGLSRFLSHPLEVRVPVPVLDLREATYKEGPLITQIRWFYDSGGVAFLLRDAEGINRLTTVSLKGKSAVSQELSLSGQNVTAFDVRDGGNYVYTVFSPGNALKSPWSDGSVTWDATGHSIFEILLPSEWRERLAHLQGPPATGALRSVLWAAVNGAKPHPVLRDGRDEIVMYPAQGLLALSPNGKTVATEIPVPTVPRRWLREFRPPPGDSILRMHAGKQNLESPSAPSTLASEYVLIQLGTGSITRLNDAPTGSAAGWFNAGNLAWSDDGTALLLPNAYPKPTDSETIEGQPCVAIFYRQTETIRCLENLESLRPDVQTLTRGITVVRSVRFASHRTDAVLVAYTRLFENTSKSGVEQLASTSSGVWSASGRKDVLPSTGNWPQVEIEQGLNEPPVVVAKDARAGISRVVWNPNPEISRFALGEVSIYHWRDRLGHRWIGGLYRPTNYVQGRRYPLVIQTHGFPKDRFSSSGVFPTAMAARALAASGIVVLQTSPCFSAYTPKSGPCNVASIDAAVRQLVTEGMVDENKVGVIGFSYTVYSVLEAITKARERFTAASVTDGWNYGYWQYLTTVDSEDDAYANEADAMVGAKPFGAGLLLWLKRAPDFNMQHAHTPLLVNGLGRTSVLDGMWEPYAALRYLRKPVDLTVLKSDEHILSEPRARLASQGGSVDWFRFWLQGYEDPNPAKAPQYRRWEKLCNMQRNQNPGVPAFCVISGR